MLTTHAIGSATTLPIVSYSFVFRVVGFIINDFKIINIIQLLHGLCIIFPHLSYDFIFYVMWHVTIMYNICYVTLSYTFSLSSKFRWKKKRKKI